MGAGAALRAIVLAVLLAGPSTGIAAPAAAPAAGLQGPGSGGGEAWLIPSQQPGLLMHATLFRPPGKGPFPLAVINHGSEQSGANRARLRLPSYPELTGWLLAKGYAVLLPQRPGHGETGGPYLEDQKGCEGADFAGAGRATAASIAAALSYMAAQPFIRRSGALVVGQSAGGWGALALATGAPRMVAGIVNFAGGRGGRNMNQPNLNCAPDRLVATAGAFGAADRVPTLWLYAENDSYFGPALSRRMADAFAAAGGKVDYELLPPVGGEGHTLIAAPDAPWSPALARFLARLKRSQ